MAELHIPIVLNKGRKGIALRKLARISCELQQFLELLGDDLQIGMGRGWLGTGFYEGSFGCTVEKIDPVEDRKAGAFKQAFRNIAKRKPDTRVRPSTIRQYTRIAEPMDLGELIKFSLPASDADGRREEWCELTKREAAVDSLRYSERGPFARWNSGRDSLCLLRSVPGPFSAEGAFHGRACQMRL
jgi:hypothetical protein